MPVVDVIAAKWEGREVVPNRLRRRKVPDYQMAAQGDDPHVVDDLSLLPLADVCLAVHADRDGWLIAVDARAVGQRRPRWVPGVIAGTTGSTRRSASSSSSTSATGWSAAR